MGGETLRRAWRRRSAFKIEGDQRDGRNGCLNGCLARWRDVCVLCLKRMCNDNAVNEKALW